MLSGHEIDDLVQRLKLWLDEANEELDHPSIVALESPDSGEQAELAAADVGLLQLAEAFTAQRHDFKLQAKSVRGLHHDLQAGLEQLAAATRAFDAGRDEAARRSRRDQQRWIEALLDLDEALHQAQAMIERRTTPPAPESETLSRELQTAFEQWPAWKRIAARSWHEETLRRVKSREADDSPTAPEQDLEGLRILQSRLQRALHEGEVRRIECTGKIVDPETMRVVQAVTDADAPAGTVVEEIRPGYLWQGQVIRPAEVKAVAG